MSQSTLPFWKRLDQWLHPASSVAEDTDFVVDDPPPDFDDRRCAIRHSVGVETQCMLIALVKCDPWLVLIRDISCTGVGFEFPYPLPPGAFIALELPRRSRREEQKHVRAQVVSAREQDDGSYVIGCRLAKRLEPDEVERVAD